MFTCVITVLKVACQKCKMIRFNIVFLRFADTEITATFQALTGTSDEVIKQALLASSSEDRLSYFGILIRILYMFISPGVKFLNIFRHKVY